MTPSAPILAVVGPTAVGKTELATEVALALDAEIDIASSLGKRRMKLAELLQQQEQ